MNTELTEEDEGFAGVCKLCGTDCGAVRSLFDERAELQREKDDLRTAFQALVDHLHTLRVSGHSLVSLIPAQITAARAAIKRATEGKD